MVASSKGLFKAQLNDVVHHFPKLKIIFGGDEYYLKGILDIPNDDGEIVGSFMIEVHMSKGFPYSFPKLFETGGDIPNDADWHKYDDESCCITVPPDEMILCRNGITVLEFIQTYAIPYFANQCHRFITGKYKNGEYSHGITGIKQFYSTLLKTSNILLWVRYYEHVFINKPIQITRNEKCFCGSKEKFKNCHGKIFQKLKSLGKTIVAQHLLIILKQL